MRALDFALRFAFFATAPFLATFAAALFPMAGPIAGMIASLAVFVSADAVRRWAQRYRLVALVLASELRVEEHFRTHPPRPFVHYVLLPILFPIWLFDARGRRELWVFRGLGVGGLVFLVGLAAFDYWRNWLPEIGALPFLEAWALVFVAQTLFMFVFLLPMAATFIRFQIEGRTAGLRVLFAAAGLSIGLAIGKMVTHEGPIVSLVTIDRVRLRAAAEPALADAAELDALRQVWGDPAELKASIEPDGYVAGAAHDRAEAELQSFFKKDEAAAFTLHAFPIQNPDLLVLQCRVGERSKSIWKAMRKNGRVVTNANELPPGVLGTKPRPHVAKPPRREKSSPRR